MISHVTGSAAHVISHVTGSVAHVISRVTGSVAHVISRANSDIVSCPDPTPREGWGLGTTSDTQKKYISRLLIKVLK